MSILRVKELSKTYIGKVNFTALDNINFDLEKGEFVGVMGPSGSGKSTFLNCLSTIDSPTKGEIILNGKNPHALDDDALARFRRQELGFVFQSFNLVDTLTVEENIILPLTLDGVSLDDMNKRLNEVANLLGISSLLKKRTFEISGGQAQRVAIARAVIHNPSLLLADEPTGNLDSKVAKDVMNIFTSINKKLNTSILMVTHDAYVASFCSRVVFIKDGKLYNEIKKENTRSFHYVRCF